MTKAKRRCTLSLCGLGWLDESEVQDTPQIKTNVVPVKSEPPTPNLRDHLRDAFARKVKASGLPPKSVAKSISEEFGVTDLVNLDVEMANRVLEWLNKEGV